jgi:hypothetical protein
VVVGQNDSRVHRLVVTRSNYDRERLTSLLFSYGRREPEAKAGSVS